MFDSHEVAANSTQRFFYIFHFISPSGNISKNYIQYHNQETHIDTLSRSYTDFTSFTCTSMCVCVCVRAHAYFILYSFITHADSGDHVKYVFKQFLLLVFLLGFTFECIHVHIP